ncbi:MAG: amino acid ABC transporter permease [Halanaerobiales bacterium]|nr:amino acid ABC transporter permease [Halanaerobiales bacterium]
MNVNLELIIKHFPFLMQGAITTIIITLSSFILGLTIGLFIGIGRISKIKLIQIPSSIYVQFVRGTPMLVQIFILYFGLPSAFNININPYAAGIFALAINSGAYVAEIVRSGIQSIDKGQMEAAQSLGMTNSMAMRYIILPQAFRRILPPLGNEFIILLKDSSLISTIALPELLFNAKLVAARTYDYFSMYIGVALIYLLLTWTSSRLLNYIEKRFAIS